MRENAADQATGRLSLAGHAATLGQVARNFNIDPSGRWLVYSHQDSDNVVVLKIDPQTGALSPTGNAVMLDQPMCVLFP